MNRMRAAACLLLLAACGDEVALNDADAGDDAATGADGREENDLPGGGIAPPTGDPEPPYGPPPGTPAETPEGIYYDIVYVRAPRYGDDRPTSWQEVFDPIAVEPGSDLMLLHPDGSEEVLVDAGDGAVVDPVLSFDGEWVYYSLFPDVSPGALNTQRRNAPVDGADIYRIHVETREIVRLTHQEWTPNTGAGNWSDDPLDAGEGENWLGFGIFNLGPCPMPGGRIMFTSSRNNYLPNKDFTFPNLQLFVMDEDGSNVELVGQLSLGSALHPTMLADGRVMFSTYEAQGLRDRRLWGLWGIWPDGRRWEPLMSAFEQPSAFHFQTQLSDGTIVVTEYYNLNNNGFGTFLRFPAWRDPSEPPFGGPSERDDSNPGIQGGWYYNGEPRYNSYPFSPQGLEALTAFTHGQDEAAPLLNGTGDYVGKVTHPSAAPHNDLLMVYSPGPANDLDRPTPTPYYDGGIYIVNVDGPIYSPDELTLILNDPDYNEQQPRPVVPYRDIYGLDQPFELQWLPNDGSRAASLPAGTPYGIVGTSTFYRRDTSPGRGVEAFDGLDAFNTSENDSSTNWFVQGADAGRYTNDDIWAVRILSLEPNSLRSYGPAENANRASFSNHADERMRILGEIPLRKDDGALDPDGNPDTSFMALIPADVPFTFQTLDRRGHVLNMAQTWHQVRPGEVRVDCGGCHAHSQMPLDFAETAAAQPDYRPFDLVHQTPLLVADGEGGTRLELAEQAALDVEYYRDIRPILQRSCVSCHSGADAPADLVLDDAEERDGYEGTWHRLANDADAQHGIPPIIGNGTWRESNASRYIRAFQSRRSLLVWKIYGERLDGWSNDDHPTESTPGDPNTLPDGAQPNDADLDFDGVMCPPPDSDAPPLSDAERLTIARWIDLGAPITPQEPDSRAPYGWFLDELRPTLTVSQPCRDRSTEHLDRLVIGAYDYYSGLDAASLSVTADFAVNGAAPGTELAGEFTAEDGIWTLPLDPPIDTLEAGTLTVRVRDHQGNWAEVVRRFAVH